MKMNPKSLIVLTCIWHDMGKDAKEPPKKCKDAGCSGFVSSPKDCPFGAFVQEPMVEPIVLKDVN